MTALSSEREIDSAEAASRASVTLARQISGLGASRLKRHSRLFLVVATMIVTIIFSYVAVSDISVRRVWDALRASDYLWLIPALAAFGLAVVTRALRWRSLFAPGHRPPRGAVLNATTIGYFYNSILPARAGEAARLLVLTRRSGAPAVEIVGTVVLERLYDVVTLLVIFFAAEPWLPHVSWFSGAAIAAIVLAGFIGATAGVLAIYGDRPLRLLLRPLHRVFSGLHLDRTTSELVRGLGGLRDVRIAGEAFLWTAVAWLLSALCAYLVSRSFHLHLSFASGVLVTVAIGLSMILPSAPAAIGVFEGATLIALRAYHVPHAVALSYALVLHAVNFIPFVFAGLWVLPYNARHPRTASRSRP